jgi:hypothetical protein
MNKWECLFLFIFGPSGENLPQKNKIQCHQVQTAKIKVPCVSKATHYITQ